MADPEEDKLCKNKLTDELSSNSEEENGHVDCSVVDDDSEFSQREISIIKSLMQLSPPPSCKETRRLLNTICTSPVITTFNRALSLTKTSNKEFVHYLGIINKYPRKGLNLQILTNFKFISQDKYLGQVIFLYFSIVDKYFEALSEDQKKSIFYRYIYLFNNHITNEYAVYQLFKRFLQGKLLKMFIYNNFYSSFYFLKDFLFDFADILKDDLIKIGYEMPLLRNYTYNLSSSVYCNWIVQRWDIPYSLSVSECFYFFDCVYFLEDIGLKKFSTLVDPLKSIENELALSSKEDDSIDRNGDFPKHNNQVVIVIDSSTVYRISCCDLRIKMESVLGRKVDLQKAIDKFNQTSETVEPLSMSNIRLFPSVKLKSLGSYLGKESNYAQFLLFCETFDFSNLDILEAVKLLFKAFVLPGESQIIERIISGFATVYVSQNLDSTSPIYDTAVREYTKIAFGFIALNTMLHNQNVEKRPSFDDYLKFFDSLPSFQAFPFSPVDKDTLKAYYESIKENEMKSASHWTDGFDKHLLSKTLSADFYRNIFRTHCEKLDPSINYSHSNIYCKNCVRFAYSSILRKSLHNLVHLNPETFFRICEILDFEEGAEFYILSHKKDLHKTLEAYKIFFESFIGSSAQAEGFIECLEKLEKQKSSVFNDIKGIFSKSFTDFKDKSLSSVILTQVGSMKFKNSTICTENCKLLSSALLNTKKTYSKKIVTNIILSNSDLIDDFSGIEEHTTYEIFLKAPEENKTSEKFPDSIKIMYFKQKFSGGEFSDEDYKYFRSIQIYNQDSFDAFCAAQQYIDDFDRIVNVFKTSVNPNTHPIFEISELYTIDSTNVLQLCTSSLSILNIKVAKNIHKDCCPLDSPMFNDFNKITYLVLKSNISDPQLFNYMSYLINYLSDSLVLLVNLFLFFYPLFHQVDRSIIDVLMKIFSKRVKNYCQTNVLCCEAFKNRADSTEAIPRLKYLTKSLIKDGFLSPNDIKAFIDRGIVKSENIEL